MDDLYLTVNTEEGTTLCLAPLSDRQISMATQEVADASGYFLFERHGSGEMERIEILAHLVSDEAADRMRVMLNLR
jgi:hypothetical protein